MLKYHFIGIKGAGMSSLACLLSDYGHFVQGSDVKEEFFTSKNLELRKINIYPFNEENINKELIVIVGNAFIDNVEHQKAKELGCEIYTYYEFLGKLSKKFYSIAVSGSHGKTTTTNLIRQILSKNEKINYLIGDGQGGGNHESELFVFEACEYLRHFLHYFPDIAVVTNIDYDHPDYYKDILDVQSAFKQFIIQSDMVVYNGDDELLKEIIPDNKNKTSYGLKSTNDYYAENISNDHHYTYYDLYIKNKFIGKIKIPLFGIHSIYNSLASIVTSTLLNQNMEDIKECIANFERSKRRFEEHTVDNQVIISDYAHHPKEIKATIEAVNAKYPFKKKVIYFQPHTYTRTITFLKDFAEALSLVDKVYLREIFSSARETNKTISVNDLAKIVNDCEVINDISYIETLKSHEKSVIIFMGAGDIDKYCMIYLDSIKNNNNF
ncbi:UDP-N-acetylmuramate--L-alanine ligase [Mycoplasmatota bacterium]|nr:UDP-N-acetylmuramate--L-alanine ligase [Mycoplasmatota bacterium]